MSEGCSNCTALQAQVKRLEVQIQALNREIRQLEKQVNIMKRILLGVKNFCEEAISQSEPILNKKSGVPLGTWSITKGAYRVAKAIQKLISTVQ